MEYVENTTPDLFGIVLFAIIAFIVIAIFVVTVWLPFQEERMYIKAEIYRSKDREHKYWKRRLKRLYISYIPIVRNFYKK